MKTKTFGLIAIAAVVTLSFSFASVKKQGVRKNAEQKSERVIIDEPAGGFAMEDKL
ncbi:hypothetical protein [Ohtaekwangia sp.]|uniref:hypothetical protein n=1 Tax=Ohtaekwangia sp. TaxID=2066019 RepID=UPI002F91C459